MAKKKEKTYEEWLEIVGEDGFKLTEVPEDMKTEEMCLTAITSSQSDDPWRTLKIVPKKFLTHDLCLQAVERHAMAIEGVPEDIISEDICLAAVRQGYDDSIEYLSEVPEKYRTKAVCIEAVKHSQPSDEADFFSFIPDVVWKDPEFMKAAKKKYIIEDYIPEQLWDDADFCRVAIESYGPYLYKVPENLKTLEICVAAVKSTIALDPSMVEDLFDEMPEAIHNEVRKKAGLPPK